MPALIQLAAAALIAGQQFDASASTPQISADQAIARVEICYKLAGAVAYPLNLRDCLALRTGRMRSSEPRSATS